MMWPHLFMKFYTADSDRTIKRMTILYPLYAYLLVPLFIIGFAGILAFKDAPLEDADRVLLKLVVETANFSPWLIGAMLSGALAAAMSTGSNLAHTAATIAARDFFAVFKPDMGDAQIVRLTRILVVVISAVSYVVALFNPASLVAMLLGAYGVIVQLLPLTLAVLFWPRATWIGAYAGLILGGAVTLLFTFGPSTPLHVHAGIWGLLVNAIALIAVSLATRPMDAAHGRQFLTNVSATSIKS